MQALVQLCTHVCVHDGGGICVCACACACAEMDVQPQPLNGNLAISQLLPMRAGKHSVMDLLLRTHVPNTM